MGKNFTALAFYLLLFSFYLLPVLRRLGDYVYALPSDSLATLGWLTELYGQNPFRIFPLEQLGTYFPLRILNFFWGPVVAYNLLVLASLVLSAWVTFLFSRRLRLSSLPAFLAGLIFSFSQYLLWFATQNIELATVFFLPVFAWAYFNFWEKNSWRNAVRLGLALTLVFYGSFQYALFAVLLFLPLIFLKLRRKLFDGDFLAKSVLALVIFLVASWPVSWPIWGYLVGQQASSTAAETISRNVQKNTIEQAFSLAARPWDYFLPSIYHPFLGRLVRTFYEETNPRLSWQLWSTYLPERAIFLGYTATFLAGVPVFFWFLRRKVGLVAGVLNYPFKVFLILFLFSVYISLPPFISIRGHVWPLSPSFFVFKVLPMFRAYIRMAIFAKFFLSLLAAIGFDLLLAKVKSAKTRWLVFLIVAILVFFDNLTVPPFFYLDLSQMPRTYGWLKESRVVGVVAEYPLDSSRNDIGGGCPGWLPPEVRRDYNSAYSSYYRSLHGKKIFDPGNLSTGERAVVWDLSHASTFEVLRRNRVEFVVVHTKDPLIGIHPWPYPQENPLDDCWQRRIMERVEKVYDGFKKVAEFEDGVIYSLELGVDRR